MRRNDAGFTLVEILIASALSAVVILGAMSLLKNFGRLNARSSNRAGADTEIAEIKLIIQNAFRTRLSLAVGGAGPIVGQEYPWDLQPKEASYPTGFGPVWGPAADANLGSCFDLVVRRHRPTAFLGNAKTFTGVEHLYFITECDTGASLPPNVPQLFSNAAGVTELSLCKGHPARFRIHSDTYWNYPTINDVPVVPPISQDPYPKNSIYPQDPLKVRNIAVCFRPVPKLTLPIAGGRVPPYPSDLFVEIRAQGFSGDDFNGGHFTSSSEQFVIPIPNSNIEYITPVSSP